MTIYEFLWIAVLEVTKTGLWPLIDPTFLP